VGNASTSATVNGSVNVGGLVGLNDESTVGNASTSATVNGSDSVGGLVGENGEFGTVENASTSSTVTGSENVGGLVGDNKGLVRNASASGLVNGSDKVGGLVGRNDGTVKNASASGPVNGSDKVGGLVGRNFRGTVRNVSASSAVTGSEQVGGLVGDNANAGGTVRNASASSIVTGSEQVGGLVGENSGTVRSASASGIVNGSFNVGGLIGDNYEGTVGNASTSATVNGSSGVGGLVGENSFGTVRNGFATGTATGSTDVDALVGINDGGTVSDLYWDIETTGRNTSTVTATGLTTAQMTGDAARTNMTGLNFDTAWQTHSNGYPVLKTQSATEEPDQTPATEGPDQTPATEGPDQTPATEEPDQTPATEGPDQSGIGGISPMFAIGAIFIIGLGGGVWWVRRDDNDEDGPETPATPGDGSSPAPSPSGDVAGRPQEHHIPDEIPGVGVASVEYDALTDRESIGAGGNADVTRATYSGADVDHTLAIKEPRMAGTLHTEQVRGMLEEAETWDRLDGHDHIVGVVDYGSEPIPWIAMEYMDGGHLGDRVEEMNTPQALWTALAITKSVRHAHRRGVAHLDLKPENVLFRTVEDAWDVPKVADWGLSKHLLEHSGSVEGLTPQYAAPEQFDDSFGETDDITDVYQLGAVFYELFTGRPPFEGSPAKVMQQVLNQPPTPPSEVADVPDQLDEILLTALAKDKRERYDSVVYIRDALQDMYDDV
jgi:serine/threonine protein kinase